jgi:hypothetical protein
MYLFQKQVGEDAVKNTLGNNWLPTTIEEKDSMHKDGCRVYNQKVCPEAFLAILQPLINDRVSIVNVYSGVNFCFMDW